MNHATSTMHRRALVLGCLVLLLVGGLAWGIASAFAESGSPAPAGADGEKVVCKIGWTRDADNLNVFLGYSASAFSIWYLNYDCLVGFNPSDLTPSKESGLAESWESDASGKVWTFKLRQGVKWQDGEPLTAEDVAFTYNYIVENDMYNWTSYTAGIKKATAVDDYTVTIECESPKPSLVRAWVPIIPEHLWSKVKPSDAEGAYSPPLPLVGSGPYQVVEWKKKEFLRLEANEEYWRAKPVIDEIIYQTYTNSDTMAQEFKAGTIDAAFSIPSAQIDQLDQMEGRSAENIRVNGYDELGINCYTGKSKGHPVLREVDFRQALNWAVDKEKINEVAYQGTATPADTVIVSDYFDNPDWHWYPPEDQAYKFDLEMAKQKLDEGGYTDSDGNGIREYEGKDIVLRLWARAESNESASMGKLVTGWFEEVGLKIKFEVIEEGALTDAMYRMEGDEFVPDYDMFFWGWYNDIDPSIGLDYFTTEQINGWSDCAWSNEEYDELQKQGTMELDTAKRKEIIDRQQQILYEESPYIVMVYSPDTEGWNTEKWANWEEFRSPGEVGNVVCPGYINDNLLFLEPMTGEQEEDGGSGATLWIVIGVVAAVVVIVIIVLVTRKKPQTMEE